MAKKHSTDAPGRAVAPARIIERPEGMVLCPSDSFNEATLQIDRAMGVADLIYELSNARIIESPSSELLTSALDALCFLLSDAQSKLTGGAA